MAADSELVTLHAEVLAVQAVLIALARRLGSAHPELGPALCAAFEDAETTMSGVAVRIAGDFPSEASLEALRIIAEMRDAVVRDEQLCGPAEAGARPR